MLFISGYLLSSYHTFSFCFRFRFRFPFHSLFVPLSFPLSFPFCFPSRFPFRLQPAPIPGRKRHRIAILRQQQGQNYSPLGPAFWTDTFSLNLSIHIWTPTHTNPQQHTPHTNSIDKYASSFRDLVLRVEYLSVQTQRVDSDPPLCNAPLHFLICQSALRLDRSR